MGIGQSSLFSQAQEHLDNIHRELKTQSELLRVMSQADVEGEALAFRWLRGNGVCDATGQIQLQLENRVGFDLELVSFSAVAGATSNGAVLFFLNSAEPQNLVWSAPQTQYNSDKFHSGMVVPLNGVVVAQFLAVGAAQLVFANIFGKRAETGKTKPYKVQLQGW